MVRIQTSLQLAYDQYHKQLLQNASPSKQSIGGVARGGGVVNNAGGSGGAGISAAASGAGGAGKSVVAGGGAK
jgi:hypothetical protein